MPKYIPEVNVGDENTAARQNEIIGQVNMLTNMDGDVEAAAETISFPQKPDIMPTQQTQIVNGAFAETGKSFNIGEYAILQQMLFPDGDIMQAEIEANMVITEYTTGTPTMGVVVICKDQITNAIPGEVCMSGMVLARVQHVDSSVELNKGRLYAYIDADIDSKILQIGYGESVALILSEEDVPDKTVAHWAYITFDFETPFSRAVKAQADESGGFVSVKDVLSDGTEVGAAYDVAVFV